MEGEVLEIKSLMIGFSYMHPFVAAGGLLLTIDLLLGSGEQEAGFAKQTVIKAGVLIFLLNGSRNGGYIVNFINKLPMNSYIAALKPNYCYSVIR